jgi:hypothetical protein
MARLVSSSVLSPVRPWIIAVSFMMRPVSALVTRVTGPAGPEPEIVAVGGRAARSGMTRVHVVPGVYGVGD